MLSIPGPALIRSDAQLLAAHVAGDPYAFEELLGRHHRRLYQLARRRTRSPEDAADVIQEAMLAAHRGAPSFRHDAAVASWLHRIVINTCLDRLRRAASQPPTAPLVDEHGVGDRTAEVDTMLLVRRALMRLPAEQRVALLAVDMHGYSVADAAALLGIAEGTVKSRCARGRARLTVLLRSDCAGARS